MESGNTFLGEHSDQIDRFDVRAHLDTVPAEKKGDNDIDAEFEKDELSEVMYERYREIIHNDFRGLGKRSNKIFLDLTDLNSRIYGP